MEVAAIPETHTSVELGLRVHDESLRGERRVLDTSRAHGCALQDGKGGGGGQRR